jgi:LuxR family transcriptional regulator, maltose regulon positive regulatory protein
LALLEQSALCLERGDAATAERLAERYLRQSHPADHTERLRGLEALIRARVALGNCQTAEQALADLRAIAELLGTNPVRASAVMAHGLLLQCSEAFDRARSVFEDALALYRRSGSPLEAGRAQFELARVLSAIDQTAEADCEARAARMAFVALGAAGDVERADHFLGQLTGSTVRRTPVAKLTPRGIEVLRLLAQGLSNAKIAASLHVSEFTVKRHVANILTKLELPSRAAAAAYVVRHQLE